MSSPAPAETAPPVAAARAEMTPAARAILEHFYERGEKIPISDAMTKIAQSTELGNLVRAAVEKATTDGATNWAVVGAILLAKRKGE